LGDPALNPDAKTKQEVRAKYDRMAEAYSSKYADPEAIARAQTKLVRRWGRPIPPGSSVLELGCADGFATAMLARAGYTVTAVDLSARMIDVAARRLQREGLHAELLAQDIDRFQPTDEFDATLAMMEFFRYVKDPSGVLQRLAACTRKKILILVETKAGLPDLVGPMEMVRAAGFTKVSWRGFFVPRRFRVGRFGLALLGVAEVTPKLRELVLRRNFIGAVVKGEKR
jgi:SAM-dependent methyltransferase